MATSPVFAASDVFATAAIPAVANTALDGSGNPPQLFAGTNGVAQRIDAVQICATGTVTNGKIRFFISTDGGATKRKVGELTVTAATPSATVSAFSDTWYPPRPLPILDANTILYAATFNAEAFVAQVFGSKF